MNIEEVFEKVKFYNVDEIQIHGSVDYGKFEVPLSYFNGTTMFEMLEDLLTTVDLNPPTIFKIKYPGGEIVLVDEYQELELELRDVKGKIDDVLESIIRGIKLDEMQLSFLKMHNII